jgi:hypothetical protein
MFSLCTELAEVKDSHNYLAIPSDDILIVRDVIGKTNTTIAKLADKRTFAAAFNIYGLLMDVRLNNRALLGENVYITQKDDGFHGLASLYQFLTQATAERGDRKKGAIQRLIRVGHWAGDPTFNEPNATRD